jgi:hypothetical protein
LRRSTATSWRSTSSSASLAAELRASSATTAVPGRTVDTAVGRSCADHRGPIASSTNPQLRTHDRLSGTHRFPNGGAFKAFTGLVPRANQTGQTDRNHQPMTKAGPRALRSQLVQSANTARKLDPQLAAVYHAQMTQRGATHRKALCVAASPAGRAGLADPGPRRALCHLRPRGAAGHHRAGQTADHRALHRHRRGPPAAALHQEGGEGPSHGARGATQVTARSWTRGDLPRASLTTPPSIVNQTTRPT